MKITVKQNKVKFSLYFPLFFLKSAAFNNLITKNKKFQISFNPYYRILKKYVKENGHFDIIEIESKEEKITIRV
jgi:hypothetical protein